MTSSRPTTDRPWHMAGTEGTGKYLVLCCSSKGRIGVRDLGNNRFRVRVEPSAGVTLPLSRHDGWKQPGDNGQRRYSTMAAKETLTAAVNAAIGALGGGLEWNPDGRVKSYRDAFQAPLPLETHAVETPALEATPVGLPAPGSTAPMTDASQAPVAELSEPKQDPPEMDEEAELMGQLLAEEREAQEKTAVDLLAIAGVRTYSAKRLGQLVRKDLDEVAAALGLEVPEGTTKPSLAALIANRLA